jgi:O-antigen/teichoic acid export membrane protein
MSVKGPYRSGRGWLVGGSGVAGMSRGHLRGSVAAGLGGKAAEMVTLVLLATVVPRVLGPGDYGRFAVPLTVVTIGSLALTLGGPTLMARFVPAAPPEARVALARAIGARLVWGRAVQLLGLALAALVAAVWDPVRFPPLETALVFAALALNVAASLALQVGLGLGRTGAWSVRYPVQNAVLIAAVLALYPSAGVTGAVVAILVSGVFAAGLGVAVAAPTLGARQPRVAVPAGAIRFGALQAAGAALVQFSQRGGVLAVAVLAGSAVETGFAALAIGIALGVTYAVLQVFTVSLPHLADHPGSVAGAEAVLRRLAGGLLLVLVPAVALAAVVLDVVVPTVFGARYEEAAVAFGPALALVVLAPLNALAVQAAALRLKPEVALASGLASALAFVVVAAASVPAWGAAGGTLAALAGGWAGAIVALWLLPGAVGGRVVGASFAGAAGVLALVVVV